MDALALLCNLYGDGPATLRRLRTAGCASFDALGELEAADLAEILGTSQPAARRFLREARLLLERVDVRELEEEERPPLVSRSAPVETSAPEFAPAFEELATSESFGVEPPQVERAEGADAAGELAEAAASAADRFDDANVPLIDKVLQSWRERDARGGVEHDVEFTEADEAVTAAQVAEEERAVGTALRPRLVDGLDRGSCERLRGAGVDTLEALVEADALALSQTIGAGLTQLMRLQFLARRVLSERGEVETSEPPDMLKPVGRPWPSTPTPPAVRTPEAALPRPSPKFSASEAPFGVATSALARELDDARERPAPAPDEGAGGPFAR